MCRYCFEGEEAGELIAPCKCSGGQRWVHLKCLRRWQRGVLVGQPTHPDFYEDDVRHRVCNVCNSEYTCKPPSRLELMSSFTGAELAALVEETCFIGSSRSFSQELLRQVGIVPESLREVMVDSHWIHGVFLIAQVIEESNAIIKLKANDEDDLQTFASQLTEDYCCRMRGRSYRLIFEGRLQDVALRSREEKLNALRGLETPCALRLEAADEGDCGEDGIIAVNLTQPMDISVSPAHLRKRLRFQHAQQKAFPNGGPLPRLLPDVQHFNGGPCNKDKPQFAIVVSGRGVYKVHNVLQKALVEAQEQELLREVECQRGLEAHGEAEAADDAGPSPKRRRADHEGADCEQPGPGSSHASGAAEEGRIRLMVFWGTAGWSRCQLMGEIASGSWGLCKSDAADVTSTASGDLYESVYPRLVFAPKTEMSENHDSAMAHQDPEDPARMLQLHRRLRRRQQMAQQVLFEQLAGEGNAARGQAIVEQLAMGIADDILGPDGRAPVGAGLAHGEQPPDVLLSPTSSSDEEEEDSEEEEEEEQEYAFGDDSGDTSCSLDEDDSEDSEDSAMTSRDVSSR